MPPLHPLARRSKLSKNRPDFYGVGDIAEATGKPFSG
jgi:hypothetical protein